MRDSAGSPGDPATCRGSARAGLKAEVPDGGDIGRAGPPRSEWEAAGGPRYSESSDLSAWRAFSR
eukprot:9173607-Pyramimonas_sp.AAC.1